MFTGLIEEVGVLKQVGVRGNYKILTIAGFAGQDIKIGESICCDGACLTVTAFDKNGFTVEASQETEVRTILGTYKAGSRINLERALKADARLGGHFVSGHVDCKAVVDYLKQVGESLELAISYDSKYDPLVIEKGSIAIQGVSLTVNAVKNGWCSVNLIPHTAKATTLGQMGSGSGVNIEFDMLGKYILRASGKQVGGSLSMEKLIESGW
jgi:riboflavin synthase